MGYCKWAIANGLLQMGYCKWAFDCCGYRNDNARMTGLHAAGVLAFVTVGTVQGRAYDNSRGAEKRR